MVRFTIKSLPSLSALKKIADKEHLREFYQAENLYGDSDAMEYYRNNIKPIFEKEDEHRSNKI